jgi:hypothetical protein
MQNNHGMWNDGSFVKFLLDVECDEDDSNELCIRLEVI